MSEPNRASSTFWMSPLLVAILLPAVLTDYLHLPGMGELSLGLMIVGAAMLLSSVPGLRRTFAAAEADPRGSANRTGDMQQAIVGPFALLGILVASLGVAFAVLPDAPRATNAVGAVFVFLFLIIAGVMVARAWRAAMPQSRKQ